MGPDPYIPTELPLADLDFAKLITLVGEANAALSEYNGLLQRMVNPAVLLSPLTNQEAVLSSRIEGTQATVEEVLARIVKEIGENNVKLVERFHELEKSLLNSHSRSDAVKKR